MVGRQRWTYRRVVPRMVLAVSYTLHSVHPHLRLLTYLLQTRLHPHFVLPLKTIIGGKGLVCQSRQCISQWETSEYPAPATGVATKGVDRRQQPKHPR